MTYPDGEVLTYGYHLQMALNSLSSSVNGTLVQQTDYDAAGRVDLRKLGADVLRTDYVYYAWSTAYQAGRLQKLETQRVADSAWRQKFEYAYDYDGDLDWIKDKVAGSDASPQLQDFTYDDLDRLDYTSVTNGDGLGAYSEDNVYDSNGRLTSRGGVTLGYAAQSAGCPDGALAKSNAVTTAGANSYCYDRNGNQVRRTISGTTYTLTYDAENRLVSVTGGGLTASFVYDGDGMRVKATLNGATTVFVGSHYEVTGTSITRYYFAGSVRVAMRRSGYGSDNGLFWLLGDHLGSTGVTADSDGTFKSGLRYKGWGEIRYSSGTTNTKYQFNGQYSYAAEFGLLFFNARWFDPVLGRFAQADSIIPGAGNPLAYDRYAGMLNNPVKYIDPSGHDPCTDGSYHSFCPPSNMRERYTHVDESQLDQLRGKTGISGTDYYQWYLLLYMDLDGWWWGMFGHDEDGLTIWDSFAVIYVFEAQYNWTDPNLSEAAIRDANGWCQDKGYGYGRPCTTEDYINHFAHEYQSAGGYVRSGFPPDPYQLYRSFTSEAAEALRRVAASFVNHPSAWNEGCQWDRPCGWANRSQYSPEVQTKLDNNQNALYTYAPSDPSRNPWIIPSWCVVYYWMGGSGNGINLGAECPIVR